MSPQPTPVYVAGNATIHAGRRIGAYPSGAPRYAKVCGRNGRANHEPSPCGPGAQVTCKRCLTKLGCEISQTSDDHLTSPPSGANLASDKKPPAAPAAGSPTEGGTSIMPKTETTETKLPSGPKMAEAILEAEGRPMHIKLIAERVIAQDQARPKAKRAYNGKTPAATISAQLTTSHCAGKTFIRVAPGCFALRAWPKGKQTKTPLRPEPRVGSAKPAKPAAAKVEAPAKPKRQRKGRAPEGVDPDVAAHSVILSEGSAGADEVDGNGEPITDAEVVTAA